MSRPYDSIWMREQHCVNCTCSWCVGSTRLHYGLNIPPEWRAWNAWYVIKYWPRRYWRWTHGIGGPTRRRGLLSVGLARAIVAETQRTEPKEPDHE